MVCDRVSDDDEELIPYAGDNRYIGAPVLMIVDGVTFSGEVIAVNVGVRTRTCFYLIRCHDGDLQDITEDELKQKVISPYWMASPATAHGASTTFGPSPCRGRD